MLISVTVIVALVAVAIIVVIVNRPEPVALPEGVGAARTLSENAHYPEEAGEDAPTLVEFLDFECEACGAFYPYMEDIREQYDGQINYVVRYFPLQGHFNSMNAALAVEAAAQQGEFEGMYRMMFETQAEWGEGQTSEAERFRGYADTLGLDLAAYDQAVANPATQERVEEDFNAGLALDVSGTPTFFLDGEQLELTAPEDLPNALDAALSQ
ncbi:thioredoxin domain-containing protein [Propioniciclava soli]|uniref:Thioredoxin domain-containing protein n=1 Tax=Propioniciclava soli TaxID=2775081 RepID=A0ABZ3C7X9_9ACTN